jgi:quercetin dioxygenase-like cupin family protein
MFRPRRALARAHALCPSPARAARARPLWLAALLSCGACAGRAPCPAPAGTAAPPVPQPVGEVRTALAAPRRTAPHGKASITLLAQGHNAFVGKLELAPEASVPEHQDPTEEYIHVLSGHATMVMDGTSYDVAPGTTIYMPANARVSVQNGPEPLVGIQVFAGPAPAKKYDGWNPAQPQQLQ